ncbi:MAG: NAD-dependent epimerase/dehydratase family protein [Patescibacteria group bacterium]
MKSVLVTGGAGFIGSHVTRTLSERGDSVVIIDNFNDYYDPQIKEDRISVFLKEYNPTLYRVDFSEREALIPLFQKHQFDSIVHLGARAGVRASIEDPYIYTQANVFGTLNILEMARQFKVPQVVLASTSAVYGGNKKIPFSETDPVDKPISPYAATKKATELMAYTYHHLHKLQCTCLRFFTVYGPWGRPDMALFKFTKNILADQPIDIYNNGKHQRDFTYIDDIVAGILAAVDNPFPYEIINLGNSHTEDLLHFIEIIEQVLGKKARRNLLPMQPGDVEKTYADITKAKQLLHFEPKTRIDEGIKNFINWYREYYHS